ncbi:hypothetical protein DFP72DRAFT_297 [Ephemerocybe angulata]|uniref:Uncharacterized protein n=1 Tax=Ephemerocybe angulata TaxID=980116 RepID=A0A8H6IJX9_9AGAR|nr:hypothetical protein DFP72DRAFT_297 [Tulosesus angulatus]
MYRMQATGEHLECYGDRMHPFLAPLNIAPSSPFESSFSHPPAPRCTTRGSSRQGSSRPTVLQPRTSSLLPALRGVALHLNQDALRSGGSCPLGLDPPYYLRPDRMRTRSAGARKALPVERAEANKNYAALHRRKELGRRPLLPGYERKRRTSKSRNPSLTYTFLQLAFQIATSLPTLTPPRGPPFPPQTRKTCGRRPALG